MTLPHRPRAHFSLSSTVPLSTSSSASSAASTSSTRTKSRSLAPTRPGSSLNPPHSQSGTTVHRGLPSTTPVLRHGHSSSRQRTSFLPPFQGQRQGQAQGQGQVRCLSWGGIDERRSQSTRTPIQKDTAESIAGSSEGGNMAHQSFPSDIPVPTDDGSCSHLPYHPVPPVSLPVATKPSEKVDLSRLSGLTILFCYPRTGAPNETVPDSWNAIPGARGCTPQACSFRDSFSEIKGLGVSQVYGISTQNPSYQAEVHERLGLPYELLSDEKLELQRALNLPVFEWEGSKVLRRVTMAVEGEMVVKVWYPVFPPDKATQEVVSWLKERAVQIRGPPSMVATDHVG